MSWWWVKVKLTPNSDFWEGNNSLPLYSPWLYPPEGSFSSTVLRNITWSGYLYVPFATHNFHRPHFLVLSSGPSKSCLNDNTINSSPQFYSLDSRRFWKYCSKVLLFIYLLSLGTLYQWLHSNSFLYFLLKANLFIHFSHPYESLLV